MSESITTIIVTTTYSKINPKMLTGWAKHVFASTWAAEKYNSFHLAELRGKFLRGEKITLTDKDPDSNMMVTTTWEKKDETTT